MSESDSKAITAVYYAKSLNLAVFPIHWVDENGRCSCKNEKCSSPGKHPITQRGVLDATTDAETIKTWWAKCPDANIGMACGKKNGFIALDLDVSKDSGADGRESLRALEETLGALPETWSQITGSGGQHYFFRYPNFKVSNSVKKLAQDIDVRSDNGYIVIAPSTHISGGIYTWELDHSPNDLMLAQLPRLWEEALRGLEDKRSKPFEIPDKINDGERNQILFKLGASLRAKGLSESAILAALSEENKLRCNPPLENKELEIIASSVKRYEAGEIRGPDMPPLENEELMRVLKDSPNEDTVFVPEVIGALAALKMSDTNEFVKAKAKLKGKVDMKDLEKAILEENKKKFKAYDQNTTPGYQKAVDIMPDFPFESTLIPNGWTWNDNGILRTKETKNGPETLCISSAPISLTKRLKNIETGDEKISVAFKRDGHWREYPVKRSVVFESKNITSLVEKGLPISSESARDLVRFFSEQERINLEILPIERSVSHFGWIDSKHFIPGCAGDIVLDFDDTSGETSIAGGYKRSGTLEEWVENVGKVIRKYPAARFQLAAGFASPLLKRVGERVFLASIWGPSGGGKTAGAYASISLWGDPELLKSTFNMTRVAAEHIAALFRDLPLLIDERQIAGDKDGFVNQLVYMLGSGQGRLRGRRQGGLQRVANWRSITLTTGEQPLAQESAMKGVKKRIIEIYALPFEGHEDDARNMYAATAKYHGTAGPAFIQSLIKEPISEVLKIRDRFNDLLCELFYDHEKSYCVEVALLCTGDYFSSKWLFGMTTDEAFAEAYSMGIFIMERLETREELDDGKRAKDFFDSWLGSHYEMFKGIVYAERYGYICEADDEIQIYPHIFDRVLKEGGFNPARIKRDWAEAGIIETETFSGSKKYVVRRRHERKREYFIVIKKKNDNYDTLPFDD